MSDPNTRKEKRTPVTLKIKFKSATLDQFIERYSVDVSHSGIFIRTKDPLAVGTQLRFEFQLQDASPLISGEGTVVWTREHDPARVGVAPGMGVRFDKLASESQAVLDKILAMKSKEGGIEPKFDSPSNMNDPKTKVAPAPLVSGLAAQSAEKTRVAPAPTAQSPRSTVMGLGPSIAVPPSGIAPVAGGKSGPATGKPNTVPAKAVGNMAPSRGGFPDEPSRDATPLPKPMPFSSVDDDFSEEAFNQPTRVAGSFEDLLRKAEQEAAASEGKGPAAAKEPAAPIETKVTVLPAPAANVVNGSGNGANGAGAARSTGEHAAAAAAEAAATAAAAAAAERRAAEVKAAEENEIKAAAEKRAAAEKKLAEERVAAEKKAAERRVSEERAAEAARPAGVAARRSGTQPTLPSVDYTEKKKRSPAVAIVALVLAGGVAFAGYKFMSTRAEGGDQAAQNPTGAGAETPPGTAPGTSASNVPPPAADPNAKPAAAVTVDAAVAAPPPAPPAPKGIEVQVVSTPPGAAVMADGKQVGVTPFALPGLEEGKSYDISLELPCYQPSKLTIDASKEKASDAKVEATLKALPRVVRVDTDPKGGAIWIDGVNTGKQTPADVPLAGKLDPAKPHKVMVKKSGYQSSETEIAPDAACTAENGKAVLLASLTLAEVEKKAPPPPAVVEKKEPVVKKPKPPKEPKEPGTTDEPPTGLMPKDSGTPASTPPADKPPVEKPADKPPVEKPADKPPVEKPADKPKDNPDDHAPDWMKEG